MDGFAQLKAGRLKAVPGGIKPVEGDGEETVIVPSDPIGTP